MGKPVNLDTFCQVTPASPDRYTVPKSVPIAPLTLPSAYQTVGVAKVTKSAPVVWPGSCTLRHGPPESRATYTVPVGPTTAISEDPSASRLTGAAVDRPVWNTRDQDRPPSDVR